MADLSRRYQGRTAPPSARKSISEKERFQQNKDMVRANFVKTAKRHISDSGNTVKARNKKANSSIALERRGTAVKSNPYIKKPAKKNTTQKNKMVTREKLPKFDYPFFTIVIVLLAFGLIMMFSASYDFALREQGDIYYYAKKQLGFIVGGIVSMLFLSFIDYHILQNRTILRIAILIGFGLMIFVKLSGTTQWGAERWLTIAGITFQPSEILKMVVIMVFAYLGEKNYDKRNDFRAGFMPFLIFLFASCGMTIMQPHLSGTVIIFLVGLILMFVSECRIKYIALLILGFMLLAVVGVALLQAMGFDYFESRVLSWQNPEADPLGETYQTYQSLITIGSGGLFGLGLGNSRQKYSFLPASHNDFVFSVICEELGFIGAVLIILLFVLLIFRGFYIASRARDKFGMLVAAGITVQIGIQALLNIGVVTNSVPNTGISLPFFSYGGSALLMQLFEMGIVLNISRKAAIE